MKSIAVVILPEAPDMKRLLGSIWTESGEPISKCFNVSLQKKIHLHD